MKRFGYILLQFSFTHEINMNWQTVHPYLNAMGIPGWQLRHNLPYHCYALQDNQNRVRGGLLLDESVDTSNVHHEIPPLLTAMLHAIQIRPVLPATLNASFTLYLVMGEALAQFVLQSSASLSELRGQVHFVTTQQIPVIATYHPADLLRQPANKRQAWLDLQQAARLWTPPSD
jgi:hypothetical protein